MIFHHFSKAIALIFDQIWPKDLWPFFKAYDLIFGPELREMIFQYFSKAII